VHANKNNTYFSSLIHYRNRIAAVVSYPGCRKAEKQHLGHIPTSEGIAIIPAIASKSQVEIQLACAQSQAC